MLFCYMEKKKMWKEDILIFGMEFFLLPRKKRTLAFLFLKNILRVSRKMNSTIFQKKNLFVSIALIKKFVDERRKYYEKTCSKSKCGNRKNLSFVFGISTFSLRSEERSVV